MRVGIGCLYHAWFSPYWVYRVDKVDKHTHFQQEYFDASGKSVTNAEFSLLNRQATPTAVMLGIGTGLLIALIAMLLYQRRYHRRATEARQGVQAGVQQLAEDFPQVVSRGGPDRLLAPKQLAVLLGAVEAGA